MAVALAASRGPNRRHGSWSLSDCGGAGRRSVTHRRVESPSLRDHPRCQSHCPCRRRIIGRVMVMTGGRTFFRRGRSGQLRWERRRRQRISIEVIAFVRKRILRDPLSCRAYETAFETASQGRGRDRPFFPYSLLLLGEIQEKRGGARDPQYAPPGWFFASLTHRGGCHGRAAKNRGVWVF